MSQPALSTAPRRPGFAWGPFVAIALGSLALIAAAFGPAGLRRVAAAAAGAHPHLPRLELITAQPLAIKVHLATVLAAFALGWVILSGRKGAALHRTLGWGWVGLMGTTAVASLFIHRPGQGVSPLHLFAALTLTMLPLGVAAARRRDVERHRRYMTRHFFGGLIVAGVAAFMPGRLMWQVFFG